MIGAVAICPQPMKGTALGTFFVPDKPLLLGGRHGIFPLQTFHLLALAANQRAAHAGVQVILENPNGGFLSIHDTQVEERTDQFAQVAACALLAIDFDSHHAISSRLRVLFFGIPFWSHPWSR